MMTLVPTEVLYRPDLTPMERAIFPFVVAATTSWAMPRSQGVSVQDIHDTFGGNIGDIVQALNSLCQKHILQQNRAKDAEGENYRYGLDHTFVAHMNTPAEPTMLAPAVQTTTPAISNYFADMPNDRFIKLHQNSINFMVKAGYYDVADLWDEYVDAQNSYNPKAMDWDAHFRTWLRKKSLKPSVASNSRYIAIPDAMKPSIEQFKLAEYLFKKHLQINKAFTMPENMQWEGYQIKLIQDTTNYSFEDILKCIEWLFSKDGDWYRPNITSCERLREKMDYIYGHTVKYADVVKLLPEGANLFDILDSI